MLKLRRKTPPRGRGARRDTVPGMKDYCQAKQVLIDLWRHTHGYEPAAVVLNKKAGRTTMKFCADMATIEIWLPQELTVEDVVSAIRDTREQVERGTYFFDRRAG